MSATHSPTTIGVSLKMYFDHERTVKWTRDVVAITSAHDAITSGVVDLVVLPSVTSIPAVLGLLEGTGLRVGAQNIFWEDRGAYTGEVSAVDLAQLGCSHAEIGHAERRRIFGETDEMIALKVTAALRNGLTPILCVGEHDRGSAEDAASICIAQMRTALADAEAVGVGGPLLVAYEPEWAIGADQAASVDHIAEVCALMRAWLRDHRLVSPTSVVYGGSAGPGLLTALGGAVDGLFLGRFAHDPDALRRVLDEALVHASRLL